MANNTVPLPTVGQSVVLVDRNQLRRKRHGRSLSVPFFLPAIRSTIPVAPSSVDYSKGRTIKYPILGNDKYGDCYYADALHCVQTWTGNVLTEATFDANAVVQRYLQVSGGDNGLDDAQIFGEWKAGIIGPNGPNKILDDMTINPADDTAIRLGLYLFMGGSWTASLPDNWIKKAAPGAVWDTDVPNARNGHAMHISGYDGSYYNVETWGFDPSIKLTPAGLKSADPEVTVHFSLEMFDAAGKAPNGFTYDELAAFWRQLGGSTLPPWNPTPGPGPTPGPTEQQIQAVVDSVFKQLEMRYPQLYILFEQIRQIVDKALQQAFPAKFAGRMHLVMPTEVEVQAIVDAAFMIGATMFPQYAVALKAAQVTADMLLKQFWPATA